MNLKIIVVIIIQCVIYNNAFSQDYKQYSILNYKAKYYKKINNIDSACFIYKELLNKYGKLFPYDNLNVAKIFASKKDTLMTVRIISDMIKDGSSFEDIMNDEINDSIFDFAAKTTSWNDLKKIKPEIDYEILISISNWLEVDQFVRNRFDDSCIQKYMYEVDSINCMNVMELIKKSKFPGYKTLGINTNEIIILIMHFTTNTSTEKFWESFFKPLLYSEALKGNISFSDYAIVLDRFSYAKNKSQIYGTYNTISEYLPINNIKEVDIRRKEIGLPILSIDAKIRNLKLPDDY